MRVVRLAMVGCLFATPVVAQPPEPPELPIEQQRAVAAIEKLRGYTSRDSKLPGQPITAVSFFEPIRDADLDLLGVFPSLSYVSVRSGRITDAGLQRLASNRALEQVEVGQSPITDAGIAYLAELPALRGLEVWDCPITDAGLVHLAKCSRLHVVRLNDTEVTDEGVNRLKGALPYTLVSAWRRTDGESSDSLHDGLVWRVIVILWLGGAAALGLRFARRPPTQRTWQWKLPIVLAAILATAVALRWAAPRAYPVREGGAAKFWLYAVRLDIGVADASPPWGGFYRPRDGWYIYYSQGMHGRFLYRVPAADVEALFPKMVDRLRKAPPGVLNRDVEAGFRDWDRSGAKSTDAVGLLTKIREARLARLQRENPRLYQSVFPEEAEFSERWQRIGRFHWGVWFEFAFLTGLILFAAWPWLWGAGRWRWAIHIALLPPLVCLPFWLGYAPLTFTSAGEHEGVLYPRLVFPLRGLPWSELDTAILRATPKPLEPLAQVPGPMLSLSGFGAPGPVAITGLGLLAGLAVIAGTEAVRRREWIRRTLVQGFRSLNGTRDGDRKR